MSEYGRFEHAGLEHGGGLLRAAQHYSIPVDDWLDLSTGINPNGWLVPDIPATCWQRLPETNDGLIEAAGNYYGCQHNLPVAGSQAAIQVLPRLRPPCKVAVPLVGYAEHRQAWMQHGHQVMTLECQSMFDYLLAPETEVDVVVIINPNNPSGALIEKKRLLALQKKLQARGGWLLVDEAFMDVTPDNSLVKHCPLPGLFVLRSVGKFFGLAGIRAGFVFAESAELVRLEQQLGPWAVPGATRWITRQVLADESWQISMRQQLQQQSARLKQLLENSLAVPVSGTALFQTAWMKAAAERYERLAQQGIFVRLLDQKDGLRFGLPAGEAAFKRLEQALRSEDIIKSSLPS